MQKKRKVSELSAASNIQSSKRVKYTAPITSHSLLYRLYPRVSTLREYLSNSLSTSSTSRRKKIFTYNCRSSSSTDGKDVLDRVIVGVLCDSKLETEQARENDFIAFTQTQQKSTCGSAGSSQVADISQVRKHISQCRGTT